jgi:citrate/tricarballylate utilization protein
MPCPEAELERSLRICAACLYCDALCPVFAKLADKRDYAPADLHYLAHLCHNCRTCRDVCQYAPPHHFALDLPSAFAAQRRRSYAEHVWPRALAPAFERPALGGAVFAAVALAVALAVLAGGRSGAAGFYAVAPWAWLAGLAGASLLGAVVSLPVSAFRFWRTIGAKASLRALPVALRDAVTLRHLGGELGCSRRRRPLHHLMAAGLGLDLAATLSAAALQHLYGLAPPYPWLSFPVLAGAVGGVAAVAGAAGLLALEASGEGERGETALNIALLGAIVVVAASGLALLLGRDTAAMPALLAVHFGAVCGFFAMLPLSKLLHAPFRTLALWRAATERDGVARFSSRDG